MKYETPTTHIYSKRVDGDSAYFGKREASLLTNEMIQSKLQKNKS